MHRTPSGDPGVIRSRGPISSPVPDDPRIPPHIPSPSSMPKQIRIVRLLPDKDQMRSSHERRNIRAPRSRTGKRIGPNAKPPITIRVVIVPPNLLFLDRTLVENDRPALLHHKRVARRHARTPQSDHSRTRTDPARAPDAVRHGGDSKRLSRYGLRRRSAAHVRTLSCPVDDRGDGGRALAGLTGSVYPDGWERRRPCRRADTATPAGSRRSEASLSPCCCQRSSCTRGMLRRVEAVHQAGSGSPIRCVAAARVSRVPGTSQRPIHDGTARPASPFSPRPRSGSSCQLPFAVWRTCRRVPASAAYRVGRIVTGRNTGRPR